MTRTERIETLMAYYHCTREEAIALMNSYSCTRKEAVAQLKDMGEH